MQPTHWLRTGAVLAVALAASATAQTTDDIYVSSEGITGLSTQTVDGLARPSQASSFQWSVSRGISGSRGQREVSRPVLSDITWTQPYDSTYNAMSQRLLTGEVGNTKVFFGRSDPAGEFKPQLQISTEQSAFTSLSASSGGERPSVSASQAFQKLEVIAPQIDPRTGEARGDQRLTYDISKQQKADGSLVRKTNVRGGFSDAEASGLYLRLGSGDNRIMGDSTDKGYEDWIKINSFQMGMGLRASSVAGADGKSSFSTPSISELTLTHAFDGAVLPILANVLVGTQGLKATLELVESSNRRGSVTTMQLELDDVWFSGLSFASGGGLPGVSESLNFSGYTQRIWDLDQNTGMRTASVFSYDVKTGNVRDAARPFSAVGFFGTGDLNGGWDTAAAEIQLPPSGGLAPVPEPSTYAMLLLGLGGIATLARRRRSTLV